MKMFMSQEVALKYIIKNDFKYRNNRIIILNNNGIKIYQGNSFLSLLSMLKGNAKQT